MGKLYGELGTDQEITKFMVGSNTYEDTSIIFSYFDAPIICYIIEDRQALLDIYIPKEDMWPDVLIKKNSMIVNTEEMWDVEFRTNYLKIRKNWDSFVEIDFRNEPAVVNGAFSIKGEPFKFSPTTTNIGGMTIKGNHFKSCGAGIFVGDRKNRLIWPNYAMKVPTAQLVPH